MPTSALNLQAIANLAGCSKMSVSRALAKKPGVSKKLRDKILRIAQEQSYRPNPLITALMTNLRVQKTHRSLNRDTVLAFIEPVDQMSEVRTKHFIGASQAAQAQGYKLECFNVGKAGLKPSRLNEILLTRSIHGLLIAPLPEGHGHFELEWSQFCIVAIGYSFVDPIFDRIVHDSYASMRIILGKCLSAGLRRIGLLFSSTGRERSEGLYEAAYWIEQKTAGAFAAIPPLCFGKWNDLSVSRWFTRYRPEVIITSSSFCALTKGFLKMHRIHVPKYCSVVNVNSFDSSDTSGINQNDEAIGATAVRLLIDKINRNDCGIPIFTNTILTPGKWVVGQTFRQPATHCLAD